MPTHAPLWQRAGFSANEFDVRQGHVPGVVNHLAFLNHEQDSIAIPQLDFGVHRLLLLIASR